jgi:hypothetical protein
MDWLDVVGWAGSALLVYSVLQTRVMRFRVANLSASAVLAGFNAVLGVWPMVGMNAALVLINVYFIVKMLREKSRGKAFEWLALAASDPYVTRVVDKTADDLRHFYPNFRADLADPGTRAALLFHGDTTMGIVAFQPGTGGVGELLIDYVVPAYQDFAPGAFVYSADGPLRAAGLTSVRAVAPSDGTAHYLRHVGFADDGDGVLTRELGR